MKSSKWAFRRRNKIGLRVRIRMPFYGLSARDWRVDILRRYRSKRHPMRAVGVYDVANRRPDRCWSVPGQEVPF